MRRVTRIKGLSDHRRLPRLNKIRLGVKVKHKTREGVTYPKETDYFVVTDEVKAIYGAEPKELDVMLPVENTEVVFPQSYCFYGSGKGLRCTGDGEVAYRADDNGSITEVDCPCELLDSGKCKQVGNLSVLLPKVSVGGVYQIDTSSFNSIIDLNSSIDYVRSLIGRIAMVPLTLVRQPIQTHHEGKKQTHYTMRLEFRGDVEFINRLRADTKNVLTGPQMMISSPVHENPVFDEGGTIVEASAQTTAAEPDQPPEQQQEAPPPETQPGSQQESIPLEGELVEATASAPVDISEIEDLLAECKEVKDLDFVVGRINSLPKGDRTAAGKLLRTRFTDLSVDT